MERYTLTAYVYDCPDGEQDSMRWFQPVITFDCMEHEAVDQEEASRLAYRYLLLEDPETDITPQMLAFV